MEEKSKHLAEWAEKADYDQHWALFLEVYGSKKGGQRGSEEEKARSRGDGHVSTTLLWSQAEQARCTLLASLTHTAEARLL